MESKKNVYVSVIIILITAIIVLLAKYNSLKSNVTLLENSLSNEVAKLEQQIDTIYQNVDDQLKKQSSLFSSKKHEFLEIDANTKTAKVNFSVIPKIIEKDMVVNITIGECTEKMIQQESGEYTATIPVYIFENEEIFPLITINTKDEIKTEYLEEYPMIYICDKYLPKIYGEITPKQTTLNKETLTINGQLKVGCKQFENGENIKFTKHIIRVKSNGKVINEKDITNLVENDIIDIQFNESYNIGNNDNLTIFLITEDTLGFIHEKAIFRWSETKGNGKYAEKEVSFRNVGETILDKDGNILYRDASNLYY